MRALTAAMKTITIWPFDEVAAFKYGELFSQLRKAGIGMQSQASNWRSAHLG